MTPQLKIILAIGTVLAGGLGAYFSGKKIATLIQSKPTEASIRQNVVAAALSQLGKKDPAPYWINTMGSPQDSSLSWCGVFALWALHQAGLALNKNWIPGKGFILTSPNPLPTTKTPQPGDIAYFDSYQHQAVVAAVYPDGTIDLVNGNGTNRAVTPSHPKASSVTAFYSIQPYIDYKLMQV